jgi:hypothetical protein
MTAPNTLPLAMAACAVALLLPAQALAQAAPPPRDGSHDFDFLIGDWKAHLKRLPERLVGSTAWIEYDGVSRTHKIFGSNANMEEFEVDDPTAKQHIRAQTLRLYDPSAGQWSIYGLDVDKGTLGLPATVGQFTNGRGEFYDYENWKGRYVLVRYAWTHQGPNAAHFEQAFSPDGGQSWEVNWILDLVRTGA